MSAQGRASLRERVTESVPRSIEDGLGRMNRTNLNTAIYVGAVLTFIALGTLALLSPGIRAPMLLSAFGALLIGWFAEQLLSRRVKGTRLERKWQQLGFFELRGDLIVTNQMSLSNPQSFPAMPPEGSYVVQVEKFSRGNSHHVAAVRLVGPESARATPKQQLTIPVDTGFLILAGSGRVDELRPKIKTAHSRILSDNDRALDAEIVETSGVPAAIVTSTGAGDGQYVVTLDLDIGRNTVISCRFLDSLDEI